MTQKRKIGLGHNIGRSVDWVERSETQQLIGVGFRSSTQPTGNSYGLKYDQGRKIDNFNSFFITRAVFIACLFAGGFVDLPSAICQSHPDGDAGLYATEAGSLDAEIRVEPEQVEFYQDSAAADSGSGTSILTQTLSENVVVSVSFEDGELVVNPDGGRCIRPVLKGARLAEDKPGTPWLPARFIQVMIPEGTKAVALKTAVEEKRITGNFDICPPQYPVRIGDSKKKWTPKVTDVYAKNQKFPGKSARLMAQHKFRGHNLVTIRLNPVRYNPVLRQLFFASKLDITIQLAVESNSPGPRRSSKLTRPALNKMTRALTVNTDFKKLLEYETAATEAAGGETIVDYLIITSNDLKASFQVLADHRKEIDGFTTQVMTVEDIYADLSYFFDTLTSWDGSLADSYAQNDTNNLKGFCCPGSGYSAFELLKGIGSAGITSIQRFNTDTGRLETAAFNADRELCGVDFKIVPGEGFFVEIKKQLNGFQAQ